MRLPFETAPARGMLFSGMPNVFGIDDDILILGFYKQGKDHIEPLGRVF